MYDDAWYSFVPEVTTTKKETSSAPQGRGHRRKESLLQQPNVRSPCFFFICTSIVGPIGDLFGEYGGGGDMANLKLTYAIM
jgi:hypothetical protein